MTDTKNTRNPRKNRFCEYESCAKPLYAKGLCKMHYERKRKHGDPSVNLAQDLAIKVCSVEGCKNPHWARGYCSSHYRSFRRHGDPLIRKQASPGEPRKWLIDSLKKVNPEECLIWPFGKRNTHGVVSDEKGRSWPVHRYALFLHTSVEPKDMIACHGPCHNPSCVNPYHLYWGTHKQNMHDKERDGTLLFGEKIHCSKLTENQVLSIYSDPRINAVIAKEYNVGRRAIDRIKRGERWGWLTSQIK